LRAASLQSTVQPVRALSVGRARAAAPQAYRTAAAAAAADQEEKIDDDYDDDGRGGGGGGGCDDDDYHRIATIALDYERCTS